MRAVFLDRDGVLNEPIIRGGKPYPPSSANEMQVSPGAAEALALLKSLGFSLFVVSNQPDVSRGTQDVRVVHEINAALEAALPLDGFYVCFHDDKDKCDCRKPLPGLLNRAAAEHDVSLNESFLIGDRWRDIDAGAAAGCRTIFIDRGYDERKPTHAPDLTVLSIGSAAQAIAGLEQNQRL